MLFKFFYIPAQKCAQELKMRKGTLAVRYMRDDGHYVMAKVAIM